MTKITSMAIIAAGLLTLSLTTVPAQALAARTWVSGRGADAGGCAITAPCQTFAYAFGQTAAGGEIDVLEPGNFGPLTITKAISIVNNGAGVAGIGATAENGISIYAGATDTVRLRGLTITGVGTLDSGIHFYTGGYLAVENCVIRNFYNSGINIAPTTSSVFSVSNTIVSNFGKFGIRVHPGGTAIITGVIRKVTANNNQFAGIGVIGDETTGATVEVAIADSETSNNGNFGVLAFSGSGYAATTVTMRNSVASNNTSYGLASGANSIIRIARSVITGNGVGAETNAGGIIQTTGNNDIDGNIYNNRGALTSVRLQ